MQAFKPDIMETQVEIINPRNQQNSRFALKNYG